MSADRPPTSRHGPRSLPRLVVHIGLPKTGTNSIQRFLARNRDHLEGRGILYPSMEDGPNHNFLVTPFTPTMPRMYEDRYRDRFEVLQQEARRRWATIARQFHDGPYTTLLLSGEGFATIDDVLELAPVLDDLASNVEDRRVVVYLRRPSEWYRSMLHQKLKASPDLRRPYQFDVVERLRKWQQLGRLEIRECSRATLVGRDVVHDFASMIGLGDVAREADTPRMNRGLSAEGMQVLQDFQQRYLPATQQVFHPQARQLLALLDDLEQQTPIPAARPRLRRDLADYIDYGTDEPARLEELFDFTYHDLDPDRVAPSMPNPRPGARQVRDVMQLDEQRLAELRDLVAASDFMQQLQPDDTTATLAAMEAMLDDAQRDAGALPALRQRLQDRDRELEQLRTSTSWRITAPLRTLSRALRAGRNRDRA